MWLFFKKTIGMGDLVQIDVWLFHLINVDWQNDWLDQLMPIWRNKYFWGPLYLFLISFVLINYPKKGWIWLLALMLCITLGDTVSSKIIKKSVKRLRPCHSTNFQPDYHLGVVCGSGYSFPSSHATNHFAVALFIILTLGTSFKWIRIPLFLWAASIAYGQVYVGVHYPFDVLFGTLLGIGIGTLVAFLFLSYLKKRELSWG